ncbi:MAG: M20/M25/M40 family metallo-hydrolase [Gammaproteobacteria bacterium]|nr:M20/M25/M40 family metallo-hydrolase [Gammaproteobacteria bacterium]
MNYTSLPFDAETMVTGLRSWIECESPTYDAAAVNRMMDIAAYELASLGAVVERIPSRRRTGYPLLGDCVRATLPHPKLGQPGILIAGHLDTVHPIGTLEQLPFRREGNRCWGPGIQDMKSGNYLSLEALRQLQQAGLETPLPVTVLFTPDEEIGTPVARELIEATARKNRYVLVPEPARPDGGVVWGRYAIARYNLETAGVPIHAGVDPRLGQSAVKEMARRLIEIEDMTTDDCTFSVSVIQGGEWVNCVPSSCQAQALSMAKKQTDLDDGVSKMLALNDDSGEVKFHVSRGVTRPVWEPNEGDKALFEHTRTLAGELGIDLTAEMAGGGSDGNFTGAMGIPTLDSLGARGAGLHTLNEHIEIDSLVERGKLMAGLLSTLD